MDAGPHLPPCFKQGLLVGLSLCKQEAGQPTSKEYSISTSDFTAEAWRLKTCTTTCDLLWVLRTHTQVLKLVWQVFDALALTSLWPCSIDIFLTLLSFLFPAPRSESRALHTQDKHSTTELHFQPQARSLENELILSK